MTFTKFPSARIRSSFTFGCWQAEAVEMNRNGRCYTVYAQHGEGCNKAFMLALNTRSWPEAKAAFLELSNR